MPEEAVRKAELTVVLMFFALLALTGIVFGGFVVQDFACARASHGWPTADGVILSAPESGAGKVRYAYVFAGENHEGRRITYITGRFSRDEAKQYSPGEAVTVHVDPDKPSASVLEPGGASGIFLFGAFLSGLLIFVGAGGMIRTLMNGAGEEFPGVGMFFSGAAE